MSTDLAVDPSRFPKYGSNEEATNQEVYYGLGSHLTSQSTVCRMCKGMLAHEGIVESQLGTTFLNYVHGIMVDNDKLGEKAVTKMVGLMRTDHGWFAANSGAHNPTLADYVISYWNIERRKLSPLSGQPELTWIRSSATSNGNSTTAGGAKIPMRYITECQYQNLPLACAAPKLITHAVVHGYEILEMSEVWFGMSKAGGMAIWSCETCRPLLLLLLCPSTS